VYMVTNETNTQEKTNKRVRSPYLFPAYNFALARQIAERVELDGGGNLSEETLAISLHLSAKSSGFQLKALTARQFGLLTKQGEILTTTPLGKRIFKPTSEEERSKAMAESFMTIPLFREVTNRFKGQPLPQGQTLRNILEREFRIDVKRVADAERVLMDSARDTNVLVSSGGNTYISVERISTTLPPSQGKDLETPLPRQETPTYVAGFTGTERTLPIIEEADLLELDDDTFKLFWSAYGEILRKRAKGRQEKDTE
jgi:hypothetical protein